jgi:hypothetical protein
MSVDEIRRRLTKEGPHIVRTSDGHEYAVPHPEFAMVGRYNLLIEEPDGFIEIIDPRHVVAIRKAPRRARKVRGSRRAA